MKKNGFMICLACLLLVAMVLCAVPGTVKAAEQPDYTAALQFEEGTTNALCPVCGESAAWTAVTQEANGATALGYVSGHYYLAEDITYSGSSSFISVSKTTGDSACVHLNGHDLTATATGVISGGKGILNMMGSGTVAGYRKGGSAWNNSLGAAVHFMYNGATEGEINLYGGTYARAEGSGAETVAISAHTAGGAVNVYADAVIEGDAFSYGVALNLYGATVNGDVVVGSYDNNAANGAGTLLIDGAAVSGNVDCKAGSLTLTGSPVLGKLTVAEGQKVTLGQLTEGASIPVSAGDVFTAAGMSENRGYFRTVETGYIVDATDDGALYCRKAGAWLVKADGTEEFDADPLTAWASGNYLYIKLYDDIAEKITMPGGLVAVDLNGHDLTVDGTGMAIVFDSANDTYDETACGVVTNEGEIEIAPQATLPNGNRYVTVSRDGKVTAHRLEMELTAVSVRTASAGLYYKATYNCDAELAKLVEAYGVVLSVNNMPGADFKEETADNNRYTVAKAGFKPGVAATSGAVTGILKEDLKDTSNAKRSQIKIYANAYLELDGSIIVADVDNIGMTAEAKDFTGTALSLQGALVQLDAAYDSFTLANRLQADAFCDSWKGVGWSFEKIGSAAAAAKGIDNSDLQFEEGTTNALCPVCGETVAWTAVTQEANGSTALGKATGHYYLAEDITYSGTATFLEGTGVATNVLCLHLNGHDLTATAAGFMTGGRNTQNIMGNGTVSGYRKGGSVWNNSLGTAVHFLYTSGNTGVVNLYGGTYVRPEASANTNPVISAHNAGGAINVYAGAVIDGGEGTAPAAFSYGVGLNLLGATVKGGVLCGAYDNDPANGTGNVLLYNAAVTGNVYQQFGSLTVMGSAQLGQLTVAAGQKASLSYLTVETPIPVSASGSFAEADKASQYVGSFTGVALADKITAKGSELLCSRDYTSDLVVGEDGTAVCPACGKLATWTAVTQEAYGATPLTNNTVSTHYYLTEDITYTGSETFVKVPYSGVTTCIHLNGHDITANTQVIFAGKGKLNVMGTGVVSGHKTGTGAWNTSVGATVHLMSCGGTVNLYGGTFTRSAESTSPVVSAHTGGTGVLNIFADAVIDGGDNAAPALISYNLPVNLYGKVLGDVQVCAYDNKPETHGAGAMVIDGATVTGKVEFTAGSLTLVGDPTLGELIVAEGLQVADRIETEE